MRKAIAIFICLGTFHVLSQSVISGGNLSSEEADQSIAKYLYGDSIRISKVRETSDLLTNYWLSEFNQIPLAKRKKAVVRHVKHIHETLEWAVETGIPVNDSLREFLLELEFLHDSYLQKSVSEQNDVLTRADKIAMMKATVQSKSKLHYKKVAVKPLSETASPFWNPFEGLAYKRFGTLADQKKIDADSHLIVLFDGLSYSGSAPKIRGMDLDLDNEWSLKWGDEVHTDVAGSRLFAALGFDVDHPYCYANDDLWLLFDGSKSVSNWEQLHDSIQELYGVDLEPFYRKSGVVEANDVAVRPKLAPYLGKNYVTFSECAVEGRPDRVKRLGSFLPDSLGNASRRVLRGALLAHLWIDNWDVREANTLLTTVHEGNYQYRISAVFSDLGTSFGVELSPLQGDFKVGQVNALDWKVAKGNHQKVKFNSRINAWLAPYEQASYEDLHWMAVQIAQIDSLTLRKCLAKAHWPPAVEELYFHKMASRRASILSAFDLDDPNPIAFDRQLTVVESGVTRVKNGKLILEIDGHPEHFLNKKGRNRNYGN